MALDVAAFDDDEFDARAWVNDTLLSSANASADNGTAQAAATGRGSGAPASGSGMDELPGVIMKLQLLSQDAADSVEACMAQMLVALPAASGTLQRLEDEVAALRQAFATVVGQAEGAEEAQDDAEFGYIAHLKALDGIKVSAHSSWLAAAVLPVCCLCVAVCCVPCWSVRSQCYPLCGRCRTHALRFPARTTHHTHPAHATLSAAWTPPSRCWEKPPTGSGACVTWAP